MHINSLSQEGIQNIARMMEASAFPSNRKSQTSANYSTSNESFNDRLSTVTNGSSASSESTNSHNNSTIGQEFDNLISATQAHLRELHYDDNSEESSSHLTNSRPPNKGNYFTASSVHQTHTIQAPVPINRPPGVPVTTSANKPTQEVAPLIANNAPSPNSFNYQRSNEMNRIPINNRNGNMNTYDSRQMKPTVPFHPNNRPPMNSLNQRHNRVGPTGNIYNGTMTMNGHNNNNNNKVVPSNQPGQKRVYKLSVEDRIKYHQDLMNCRKILIESGRLRREPSAEGDTSSSSFPWFFSTLRGKKNKKNSDSPNGSVSSTTAALLLKAGKKFDAEVFKHFPQSYWSYTKLPIHNSLMVISDPEQESDSVNNFNLLLEYSGVTLLSDDNGNSTDPIYDTPKTEWAGTHTQINKKDHVLLAQKIIERVVRKESSDVFKNEFFLQLIKQTTDNPEPNSMANIKHWQIMALACSITYPTDRRVLSYLRSHLRKCALDQATEEGAFASFCLKNLGGTIETRGRKYPPSKREVISTINRRRVYARIHFLDGQFQAVEFDACATIAEVMEQIQLKIGLRPNAPGYALYQPLGDVSQQSLQPEEKVGDALSLWEKWHEKHNLTERNGSPPSPQHYFIFKKHLFFDSFLDMSDLVERELIFHQYIYRIRSDNFPISGLEAAMLCALKAQIELGDYNDQHAVNYGAHMATVLPLRLLSSVSPNDVISQHQSMRGMDTEMAKNSFFNLIKSWPLCRATIFDVQQSYTSMWPKNLWLAVDSTGIHLLEHRTRNILVSCDYRAMIDYSSRQTSLMIVALRSSGVPYCPQTGPMANGGMYSKTTKFIFLTHHAMQIATLIRDYTTILANARGVGRRKSVEFDLQNTTTKSPLGPGAKGPLPLPPPRPSISARQQNQIMSQDMYGNIYGNVYGGCRECPQQHPSQQHHPQPPQQTCGQQQQMYQPLQTFSPNQPQPHTQQAPPFQPTHRRQRPMSILYKPPPAIMSEPEHV